MRDRILLEYFKSVLFYSFRPSPPKCGNVFSVICPGSAVLKLEQALESPGWLVQTQVTGTQPQRPQVMLMLLVRAYFEATWPGPDLVYCLLSLPVTLPSHHPGHNKLAPQAKYDPQLAFVKKKLLEYNRVHLFTLCLWLLLCYKCLRQRHMMYHIWPRKPKMSVIWPLTE